MPVVIAIIVAAVLIALAIRHHATVTAPPTSGGSPIPPAPKGPEQPK